MIYPNIFRCTSGQGTGGGCCHGAHVAHNPGCSCCHNCNKCDANNRSHCTNGKWNAGCKDGCSDGCSDSKCTNATCDPCYGCQGCNSCYGCNGTCNGCNSCDGCQTCVECQSCNACQSCNTSCYEENSGYDRSCEAWFAGSRRALNRTHINCSNSCSNWY